MSELRVIATDGSAELVGTITLAEDGAVTTTGAGAGLFAALRRKMRDQSDADVFGYLAQRGWSNGRASITPA